MFKKIFEPIDPEELNENFFRLINKNWMLITAGETGNMNTMTASWGATGILWNKPIAICFIRPQRHTFGFVDHQETFTLSFFDSQYAETLNYCGTHSGRSVDKIGKTGLKPIATPKGSITFEQARLVFDCRKLYADFLKEDHFIVKRIIAQNYSTKDFHKFFIGEIEGCYKKL